MRRARFDTRLLQVFVALAAMTLIVGGASLAVNRYLIGHYEKMIGQTLPSIEQASRVGVSADLVGPLVSNFMQARTHADLAGAEQSLRGAVKEIQTGLAALEGGRAKPDEMRPDIGALVTEMGANAHAALDTQEVVASALQRISGEGDALSELLRQQTDLARLRVTSGLSDLYSRAGQDDAARIDTLSDDYFFAFERIGELARAVDLLHIGLMDLPAAGSRAALDTARGALRPLLDLAKRRIPYLPTASGRAEIAQHLARFEAELGEDGLYGQLVQRLQLQENIARSELDLRGEVRNLSQRAQLERQAVLSESLAQVLAASQRAERTSVALVLILAGALALSFVILLYARNRLVQRMRAVSERIVGVARGDFSTAVPISGQDEIGTMEKAINVLRRRAQEAMHLRKRLEDEVVARTGEVLREMRASDAARVQAEAADRRKTQFLARMSHEIRTPLNGIIGMLSLLRDAPQGPDAETEAAMALASARNLLEITDDILTLSSAQDDAAGRSDVHFDLNLLIDQMKMQLEAMARPKGLVTEVRIAERVPRTLFGDVTKIRQILLNLISNAVKYTPGGQVTLGVDSAALSGETTLAVSFCVSDTGVGMAQDIADRAFDLYTRSASARRSEVQGSGLGLAISRQLTDALGGGLSCESELGVGSRFTLTVPLREGDATQIISESEASEAEVFDLDVLVIEDHPVNRMVARGFLHRLGCRVSEAEDGAAGLQRLRNARFDLVLIDLDLPDMTGAEVAHAIAAERGEAPQPRLVALTAHMLPDTPQERARLGVCAVLAKPLSPRALVAVLSQIRAGRPGELPAGEPRGDALPDRARVAASLSADMQTLGAVQTAEIVRAFLEDLPAALASIVQGPPELRRKAAHRLKGAASNFGFEDYCALLARIEAEPECEPDARLGAQTEVVRATLIEQAHTLGLQIEAASIRR